MNLQFRIAAWLLLIGILAIGVWYVVVVSVQQRYLTDQFHDMATAVGDTVRYSLETSMLDNRREEIRTTIQTMRQQPMVEEIAIYNPSGDVWEATDPEQAELDSERSFVQQAVAENRAIISSGVTKGKSRVSIAIPIANTAQCQRCHNPAQKINGVIRVYLNASSLDQHVNQLSEAMVGMAIFGFVVLAGALMLTLRLIVVNPFSRMVKIVQAFGEGNYAVKMREEERRSDELGMLARSFGEMGERIARQTSDLNERISELANELARLNIFGKIMASKGDDNEVLEGLVDTTRRLLHADASAVHLINDRGELVRVACTGDQPSDSEGRIETGIGIIRWVVDMRNSAIVPDLASDPRSQLPSAEMQELASLPASRYYSLIAVPLVAGSADENEVLGALSVFTLARRHFTGGDISLLSAIAKQAAVAIQNAQTYARVSEQSITDGLTGIYNRRYLFERLEDELARASVTGTPLSVLFLDVDSFKRFNDLNGHASGDMALQAVANLIKESCRAVDLAARYGGEEFVVVLPETNGTGAEAVAERIRDRVDRYRFEGRIELALPLSVSIGIASFPEDALSASDLIDRADWAMYYAKRKGRNQVQLFNAAVASQAAQDEQTVPLQ